jgi:hypothetical protein
LRRKTQVFLVVALLALYGVSGWTAEPKDPPPVQFSGTVENVKKDRLVVQVTNGIYARAVEVPVTSQTKTIIDGQPGKLRDLKARQSVLITVDRDHVTAVRIEVVRGER